MSGQDKKMKEMFIEEGKDNLQTLEKQFSKLEEDPEDEEALLEIFRVFHTFKGISGTYGLAGLSNLFHKLEAMIQDARDHKIKVTKALIDALFQSLDIIENALNDIDEKNTYEEEKVKAFIIIIGNLNQEGSGNDAEDAQRKARMREIFQEYGIEDVGIGAIDFSDESQKYYRIGIEITEDVKLKATRVLVIIKYLTGGEGVGRVIRTFPPILDLIEGKFELDFTLIFQSEKARDEIIDRINLSDEIGDINIEEISVQDAQNQIETFDTNLQVQNDLQEFRKTAKITNVRVDVVKLDELMEIIGELLINLKQIGTTGTGSGGVDYRYQIQTIEKLMLIMQENILQMQLVPVNTIFRRFPRMVRSLSLQQNKEVKLTLKGTDLLVDRKILDEINEALVHLIRNAVSHGIEGSRERLLKNKSEVGNIILAARREKNMLAIDVIDDGKGIDPEQIKEKALEKGFITLDAANSFTQAEAYRVMFNAGFSTLSAAEVTEVSGRGIGLNTVKEKVEELSGIVTVNSTIDVGTTFTLIVPLSMSIIKALLVRVGPERFSIPLDDVQYISCINRSEIQDISGVKYISFQGAQIPLYDLSLLFNIETNRKHKLIEQDQVNVIFIERGNRKFCVAVEEFLEQTEIVVKKMEQITRGAKGISGATILSDGTVSLILDPFTLVTS